MPKPVVLQLGSELHPLFIVRWRTRGLGTSREFFNWFSKEKKPFRRNLYEGSFTTKYVSGYCGFRYSNVIQVWLIIDPICQMSFIRWLYDAAWRVYLKAVVSPCCRFMTEVRNGRMKVGIVRQRPRQALYKTQKRWVCEMCSKSVCFSFSISNKCDFMPQINFRLGYKIVEFFAYSFKGHSCPFSDNLTLFVLLRFRKLNLTFFWCPKRHLYQTKNSKH